MANEITDITRRNIADDLTLRKLWPAGRLDEVEFLSRLFDLAALPTTDYRIHQFSNMARDVWQHRINNSDWPNDWFWTDDRLNLLVGPDETFVAFLAEMVHPLVRPDPDERAVLLELFNGHLAREGWEIAEVSRIGAHPVYGGRRVLSQAGGAVAAAKQRAFDLGDYVSQQIARMEHAIGSDPELAIGTAKEYVETICRTLLRERGIPLPVADDMPALVKTTVANLPIVPAGIDKKDHIEKTITTLLNNLSSIGRSMAELRNAFGTGHGRDASHRTLDPAHARLAVHAATAVGIFLFEVHRGNPV